MYMAYRLYVMSSQNKRILYALSVFNTLHLIFVLVLTAIPGNKGLEFCRYAYSAKVDRFKGIPLPNVSLEAYHSRPKSLVFSTL